MKRKEQRKELMTLVKKSLKEMEDNQLVILLRGDLLTVDYHGSLYRITQEDIKRALEFLKEGDEVKEITQYLTEQVFMKHRSFFMDLFDTHQFPSLFDLCEYE